MKTRCALKVLYRIRSVFPKNKDIAESLIVELKKIIDMKDSIQKDIWTLAQRYHKNLQDLIPTMKESVTKPQNPTAIATTEKKEVKPSTTTTTTQAK
jgi:flagellar biosynthesis chaperone FliJ